MARSVGEARPERTVDDLTRDPLGDTRVIAGTVCGHDPIGRHVRRQGEFDTFAGHFTQWAKLVEAVHGSQGRIFLKDVVPHDLVERDRRLDAAVQQRALGADFDLPAGDRRKWATNAGTLPSGILWLETL